MASSLDLDKIKIKQILTATIASLCNNSLTFNLELRVEGLLGITLDKENVILVNINEVYASKKKKIQTESVQKSSVNSCGTSQKLSSNAQSKNAQCSTQAKNIETTQSTKSKTCRSSKASDIHKKNTEPHSHSRKQDFQTDVHTNLAQPQENVSSDYISVNIKKEPDQPKVVTERLETECVSMQHDGGYAELQKSVKTVQRPEGLVEEKQLEWKTYDADGKVLEHRKVEACQPVEQSANISGNQYENYNDQTAADQSYNNQQDYYYTDDQGYENYQGGYYDNQNYSEPCVDYGAEYDQQQQARPMGRKQPVKRGSKRGARGGTQPFRKRSKIESEQQPTGTAWKTKGTRGCAAQKVSKKSQQQFHQAPQLSKAQQSRQNFSTSQQQFHQQHSQNTFNQSPYKGGSAKENEIMQRAITMVTEGKITASAAIDLFGIPKSTFYRKLSSLRGNGDEFDDGTFADSNWQEQEYENYEYQ